MVKSVVGKSGVWKNVKGRKERKKVRITSGKYKGWIVDDEENIFR